MLSITSATAGLKKHSIDQLKDLLAGKVVTLGSTVQSDAFVSSGATTPQDLALQILADNRVLGRGFKDIADQIQGVLRRCGNNAIREITELVMLLHNNFDATIEYRMHNSDTYENYLHLRKEITTTFFIIGQQSITEETAL